MYLVVYFSSHYEGRAEPGFVFNPRLSMLGAVKMADGVTLSLASGHPTA